MSENRDSILANFQECTGIHNSHFAVSWLENFSWNLIEALKYAIPSDSPITTGNKGNYRDYSGKSNDTRFLQINLQFLIKKFKLVVTNDVTVLFLKTLIFSEVGIPPCQQLIAGWPCIQDPSDNDVLANLGMPSISNLYLLPCFSYALQTHELNMTEPINVHNETPNLKKLIDLRIYDCVNKREYCLKLFDDKRVSEVKSYVYCLIEIPVERQLWCGWPSFVTDAHQLFQLNLETPYHCLLVQFSSVCQSTSTSTSFIPNHISAPPQIEIMESEGSFPDLEDSSSVFVPEDAVFDDHNAMETRRSTYLIPPDVQDEVSGSEYFVDGFYLRYGDRSPTFFPGNLNEVLREACYRPARERRMLAIYIHHDSSVLSNVFCTEILGSQTVLDHFRHYFVLWGWDITNDGNRTLLLNSLRNSLGVRIADTIQNMEIDQFPTVLVVSRSRGNTEILNIINGNIGVNEFLENLIRAIDVFVNTQETEISEEDARAARERIKNEQDQAYQESLEKDRAKEEARKQSIMSRLEEEERLKKLREEEAVRRIEERSAVASNLPAEPNYKESTKSNIVTFRFRAPGGETFERKFLQNQKLKVVFDYLLVRGYRIDEFKLISLWPRKDISVLNADTLLEEMNLCPQETFILEKR